MPETIDTPNAPDRASSPDFNGIPEHLKIQSIDDMRYQQHKGTWAIISREDLGFKLPDSDHAAICDLAVRDHLLNSGIEFDDPNYSQSYDILRSVSTDRYSEVAWSTPVVDEEAGINWPSIRDHTEKQLEQLYSSDSNHLASIEDTDEDTDMLEGSSPSSSFDPERINELHRLVKDAQAQADAAYDARMKTGYFSFTKTRDKRDDELVQTMQALTERTAEFDANYIEMMRLGGATEEQIAEAVAMGAKERNDERAKSQHDKVMGEGWRAQVHNTMKSYAELDTKKKIIVGALGGAALAGVGVVAAAGGAFFATAGAIGLVGARAAKVYGTQRSQLYVETQPTEVVAYKNDDGSLRTTDEILVEANTGMQEATVERINRAEKIKRNAAIAGGLAIGLAGVGTVFEHMDTVQGAMSKAHSWFSDTPSDGVKSMEIKPGPVPDVPSPTAPSPAEVIPVQPAAFNISVGEGWYQTFGEIGIANPSEQAALLNNQSLMQELANRGLAYRDYSIGGWGINMTSNGQMPAEAVRLIRDYASQSGYSLAR